jgi:hypothetical protein
MEEDMVGARFDPELALEDLPKPASRRRVPAAATSKPC